METSKIERVAKYCFSILAIGVAVTVATSSPIPALVGIACAAFGACVIATVNPND